MTAFPAYLKAPLEFGTGQGVPTSDSRFAQVTRLAEAGEHAEAAELAETILAEGVLDIRLIKHGIFARFLDQGLDGLGPLLEGLGSVLRTSAERIGPRERRELHLHKSLGWLFEHIDQQLRYHRTRRDPSWDQLASDAHGLAQAAEQLDALVNELSSDAQGALDEPRSRLRRTLSELRLEIESPSAPEEADIPQAEPSAVRSLGEDGSISVEASPPLKSLLEKLQAFELLTRRGDFRKASMVAYDVQSIIDRFDPREYFPDLFADFGGLLSDHVESIAPYWDQKDSVGWKMLEQFYRVDLQAFVGEPDRERS